MSPLTFSPGITFPVKSQPTQSIFNVVIDNNTFSGNSYTYDNVSAASYNYFQGIIANSFGARVTNNTIAGVANNTHSLGVLISNTNPTVHIVLNTVSAISSPQFANISNNTLIRGANIIDAYILQINTVHPSAHIIVNNLFDSLTNGTNATLVSGLATGSNYSLNTNQNSAGSATIAISVPSITFDSDAGNVSITQLGSASSGSNMLIESQNGTTGTGGQLQLLAGSSVSGDGGALSIVAGQSISGTGGNLTLAAGDGAIADGIITIQSTHAIANFSSTSVQLYPKPIAPFTSPFTVTNWQGTHGTQVGQYFVQQFWAHTVNSGPSVTLTTFNLPNSTCMIFELMWIRRFTSVNGCFGNKTFVIADCTNVGTVSFTIADAVSPTGKFDTSSNNFIFTPGINTLSVAVLATTADQDWQVTITSSAN